jgi:nucleotide-binding universal stress UspA family protein
MFAKILLPLDSSDLAEYALQPAVHLAQQAQAELLLLHVLEHRTVLVPEGPDVMGHSLYYPETTYNRAEIAARDYLNGFQYGLAKGYPEISWRFLLEDGDPAAKIVDTAVNEHSDLIIMSTHGYSGLTRWVLGSVAEKVLRHAPCPVLIVRADQPIKNVLITLDGSKLAESSLPLGLAAAQAFAANVTLLRVDDLTDRLDAQELAELNNEEWGLGERLRASVQEEIIYYLAQIRLRYGRDDLNIDTATCYGKPSQAILNFAESHDIDLIVMSTHGRTGLSRWRYGSVTEKVLRGADCDMLISRPQELEE